MSLGKCQNRDSLFLEFGCSVSQNRISFSQEFWFWVHYSLWKDELYWLLKNIKIENPLLAIFSTMLFCMIQFQNILGIIFVKIFDWRKFPHHERDILTNFDKFDKLTKKYVTLKNKHIWFWIIYNNVMKKNFADDCK